VAAARVNEFLLATGRPTILAAPGRRCDSARRQLG
jgi:hypothetical protein